MLIEYNKYYLYYNLVVVDIELIILIDILKFITFNCAKSLPYKLMYSYSCNTL